MACITVFFLLVSSGMALPKPPGRQIIVIQSSRGTEIQKVLSVRMEQHVIMCHVSHYLLGSECECVCVCVQSNGTGWQFHTFSVVVIAAAKSKDVCRKYCSAVRVRNNNTHCIFALIWQ